MYLANIVRQLKRVVDWKASSLNVLSYPKVSLNYCTSHFGESIWDNASPRTHSVSINCPLKANVMLIALQALIHPKSLFSYAVPGGADDAVILPVRLYGAAILSKHIL